MEKKKLRNIQVENAIRSSLVQSRKQNILRTKNLYIKNATIYLTVAC